MEHPIDLADDQPLRRLSRPRSLVSSSYLLQRLEQHHKTLLSLTPSISFERGEFPTFTRSKSRERSQPQDARSKLRAYLQASRNVRTDSSDDDEEEGQRGLPGIARSVKHRLSRTGTTSSTAHSSSAGASTSQLSSYSNPPLDLTDSARMVEEIKEKAYMDSIAALNHVPSPVDGNMHVDSIPSPIRRKSLFTPGIATRTPNDILRKPPPPQMLQSQADRDYYFNPALSTSSPLARLAALDTGRSGRSTPTLDYSHLGGLKLGTLRVTNGPASPKPQEIISHPPDDTSAPYVVDRNQVPETTAKEEIYEKAGAALDDSTETNEEVHSSGSSTSLSSSYSHVNHEPKLSDAGERRNWYTTSMPPVCRNKSSLESEGEVDVTISEEKPSRGAHSKWLNRKQSLPSGFFASSSDAASTLAFNYQQALPDTPFQRPQTANGDKSKSRGSSNTDGVDDSSFDDEGLVMRKSYRSALEKWRSFVHDADQRKPNNGSRDDAYRKLNANSACRQRSVSRPTSSSASAKTTDLRSICTDPSTMPLRPNADSGYNSSDSLAFSKKTPVDEAAIASSTPDTSENNPRKSSRLSSSRRMSWSSSRKARTSDVASSVDKQPFSSPSAAAAAGVAKPAPSAVRSAEPINTVSKAKMAPPTITIPSPRSVLKPHKMGKLNGLSQHLPVNSIVIQGSHQLSQFSVPEVPRAVASRHAERLHNFPSLDHTFPSLQHTSSQESLLRNKRGSVPIRFPSPAQSLERRDSDSICRTDLDWSSSRSTRSKKLKSASKAQQRSSQAKGLVSITDLGTVADCLGGSPYDVAKPFTSSAQKRASISHPHQISTALPRAKSMIAMTNEPYMQFAESQNRMSTHSLPGLCMSSSKSFDSMDNFAGNFVRQRCMMIERPPVPALPAKYSAQQIKRDTPQPSNSFGRKSPNHEKSFDRSGKLPKLVTDHQAIPALSAEDAANVTSPDALQLPDLRRKSFNDRDGPQVIPNLLVQNTVNVMSLDAPRMPDLRRKSFIDRDGPQIIPTLPIKDTANVISPDAPLIFDLRRKSFNDRGGPQSALTSPAQETVNMMSPDAPQMPDLGRKSFNNRGGPQATPTLPVKETINVTSPDAPQTHDLRRKSFNDRGGPQTILSLPVEESINVMGSDAPQTPDLRRKSFKDRRGIPGKLTRPGSMYEKVPPVPVLPSRSQLEQIEAHVSKPGPDKPIMVAASVKTQKFTEKMINAGHKPAGKSSDAPDNWKSLREAWSQRRKSAGDALLLQSQVERLSLVPDALDGPGDSPEFSNSAPVGQEVWNNSIQTATAIIYQRRPPLRRLSKSHSALPNINGLTSSARVSRPADKPSQPKTAEINALAGRFAGGFHYGYEPGCGLGGSAGTRMGNSKASRKSVGVSQGYGLDLSDVPIFVIPR